MREASTCYGHSYSVQPVDPGRADVRALIAASDAYLSALYPAESNHLTDVAVLSASNVTFLAVICAGEAVACGALLRSGPDACELKRMFVSAAHRGRGVGRMILRALEAIAREEHRLMRLETGIRQHEAIRLYRSSGYAEIAPFGGYAPDPLSLFMEKRFEG